jgi:hypothetical protein
MKTEEQKFLWEIREFANAHAGNLISGGTQKDTFSIPSFRNQKSKSIFVRIAKSKI